MPAQQFRGAVEAPGATGATSFLEIPSAVVEALGAGQRPPVAVTLNGYTYRTTIAVYGGRYYVPVRREVREGARVIPGQPLDVTVTLDQAPRTVEVPDDLGAALDGDPDLRATFDKLSYSHRKEYVDWIESARREATRRRRVEQAATMLRQGIRTPKP
jgi:hypothetical protein